MENELLPIGKEISKELLKSSFIKVEDTPYGNLDLGYSIILPNDWGADSIKAETNKLNSLNLKPLAIYAGALKNGSYSYIQIQAIELTNEITAEHWLRHYASVSNRKITTLKELSVLFADSLMTFQLDNNSFIARVAVRIDGNRAFLILCLAIESSYSELSEKLGLAVASFNLLSPSSKNTIEKHSRYSIANIEFSFPISWVKRTPNYLPEGRDVLDLYRLDDEQILKGMIRVKAVDKKVMMNENAIINATLEEFSESNVAVKGKIFRSAIEKNSKHFQSSNLLIYNAMIDTNPNELWISTLSDYSYSFVISLLTPSRDVSFYDWAINKRAYEIILESIK